MAILKEVMVEFEEEREAWFKVTRTKESKVYVPPALC